MIGPTQWHTQAYGALVNSHTLAYVTWVATSKKLNDRDWLEAGFAALMRHGAQGIKAESLARDLGVSKGSFYWHYTDVSSLKKAMLDFWLNSAVDELNSRSRSTENPKDRLLASLDGHPAVQGLSVLDPKVELAIRDWSRYDADAAVVVRSIDRKRHQLFTEAFTDLGVSRSKSSHCATALYGSMLGIEEIAQRTDTDKRRCLMLVLDGILQHSAKD